MKRLLAIAAICGIGMAHATEARLSRAELFVSTKPMGEAYMKILEPEPAVSATARRIERVYAHVLRHAKGVHPEAGSWDWGLVLVARDVVAPFALPHGQIFVSPKWVAARRLNEAEIGFLLAHEMAHVIAEHMLERLSAMAAARPALNMRVADVLRMIEQEWHLVRELEPLMQAQELEADRIGLTIACAAGVPRSRALTLFDKLARAESGNSYLKSHDEPTQRKRLLAHWARERNLACLD
jgi:predicted Zn-dependent protease